MKTHYSIQAGEFKAKCLRLMDEVKKNHFSITITKHGKPIAKLVPIDDEASNKVFFGCMKDTITIVGDIISPIETDWESNE